MAIALLFDLIQKLFDCLRVVIGRKKLECSFFPFPENEELRLFCGSFGNYG